jgi:hypothetical protein
MSVKWKLLGIRRRADGYRSGMLGKKRGRDGEAVCDWCSRVGGERPRGKDADIHFPLIIIYYIWKGNHFPL